MTAIDRRRHSGRVRHCAARPGQFPRQGTNPWISATRSKPASQSGLRRLPISTSVDVEGEVVWTQEYLRYRVNGCGRLRPAVQSVLTQVAGRPAPPVCKPVNSAGFGLWAVG